MNHVYRRVAALIIVFAIACVLPWIPAPVVAKASERTSTYHHNRADNDRASRIAAIEAAIEELKQELANIQLTPGPQGPPGEQGPQGIPGTFPGAGQVCPSEQSVVGFSVSGAIICSGSQQGGQLTSLENQAQAVENALLAAVDNENLPVSTSFSGPFATGHVSLLGFAFCSPPDPAAAPNPAPDASNPLYGCTPALNVAMTTNGADSVFIRIGLDNLFLDVAGDATVLSNSTTFDGYLLVSGATFEMTAPLMDNGDGTWSIGGVQSTRLTTTGRNWDLQFGDPSFNIYADLFMATVGDQAVKTPIEQSMAYFADRAISGLPPLTL